MPTNDKEELNMMMNRMNTNAIRTQRVEEIMSREPLALSPMMRAGEALARLRQVGVPRDFMANCYVVDGQFHLLGLVTVRTTARAAWTPEAPAWARPRVTPAPSPAAKKPGRAVSSSDES